MSDRNLMLPCAPLVVARIEFCVDTIIAEDAEEVCMPGITVVNPYRV